MNGQLLLLLAYAVLLIGIGGWIGRRVRTTGAFFVAGRQLGPGLLFATLLAANIGAGSTVGAASLGYQQGFAAWWWVGSAGLGTFVLAFWVGPRLWRIARDHELTTAGDYLEWRFDARLRGTVTALLWLGTLSLLAGQLIAMARILEVVAGVPHLWGCVIGGLVMTSYFVAGGLLTSAWVNLVQLAVLVVGFVVAVPMALRAAGGAGALRELSASLAAETGSGFWGGWIYLPLLLPAFFVSPGLVQKIYGARDAATVRLGTALTAVALLAFAALPALLGVLARGLHPDLPSAGLALPALLAESLPLWIGTLGLAAVLSAEISSADAILFMLSTSWSRDLYQRFLRPAADDRTVLRVARWAAVGGGVLGVLLAIVLESVIGSLTIFYSLLSVLFFVPVVFGLATRLRPRAALGAVLAGVATLFAVRIALIFAPDLPPLVNPTLIALLASTAVATVASVAAARRRSGQS